MSKSSSGAMYGMGLIGALVYNIQYAHSFKEVLWGLFKTMFWPAFLVYEVLSRLQSYVTAFFNSNVETPFAILFQ